MRTEDFHIHSIYSDGSDTPAQIMQLAKQKNIKTIALTDHDTIAGLDIAKSEADKYQLNFVPGIELSVRYEKTRLIHILGLGIDHQCEPFKERYAKYRRNRELAVDYVLEKLLDIGVQINRSDLQEFCFDHSLDRQAIAKYLIAKGYATSMPLAWMNYLDTIEYAPGELLEPIEAFELIHAGGGKAYIAHIHKPIGLEGFTKKAQFDRMAQLKALGLDGIESHYPSYSHDDIRFIQQLVEQLDLLQCGGSDYHGTYRSEVTIGD